MDYVALFTVLVCIHLTPRVFDLCVDLCSVYMLGIGFVTLCFCLGSIAYSVPHVKVLKFGAIFIIFRVLCHILKNSKFWCYF
jgi:hypothetical protein